MKKFLALSLALVMLFGLVACAGSNPTSDADDDGPVKLTIGIQQHMSVSSFEENAMTQWLEEECDVDLSFVEYTGLLADIETKLSTTIAANKELPDILVGLSIGDIPRQIYGNSGYLLDMQEYFDDKDGASKTFWERLQELSETDQDTLVAEMADAETGAIYALPTINISLFDDMNYQAWINKEWLAKVDKDMPTNCEELLDVLRAFEKTDCNGNGVNDEVPLVASVNGYLGCFVEDWILNMFTWYNKDAPYQVDDNGKLVPAYTTDAYREGVKFLRQLYKEGLLTSLVYTASSDELRSMATPADGVARAGIFIGHLSLHSVDDSKVLDQYAPLKTWGYAVSRPIGAGMTNMISGSCKNPDKAFEVLMKMWTKEGSWRLRYGEKGFNWDDPDEGATSVIGKPAEYKLLSEHTGEEHISTTWGWARGTFVNAAEGETAQLADDLDAGVRRRMQMHSEQLALFKEAAESNPEVTCPKLVYTLQEKQEVEMAQINIDSRITNYRMDFVTGKKDINDDAVWAQYLKEMKEDGLDKVLELAQKAYDRQTKNK